MATTSDQERRLASSLNKWARILDESCASLAKHPESLTQKLRTYDPHDLTTSQFREIRSIVFAIPADAHLVAICLRQIDEHARELAKYPIWTGDVATKGAAFRSLIASEELRDLRDVIEHGAEYIAGKGRKPELVQEPNNDWPSGQMLDNKIVRISVFGRGYNVSSAIYAAIQLAMVLPRE